MKSSMLFTATPTWLFYTKRQIYMTFIIMTTFPITIVLYVYIWTPIPSIVCLQPITNFSTARYLYLYLLCISPCVSISQILFWYILYPLSLKSNRTLTSSSGDRICVPWSIVRTVYRRPRRLLDTSRSEDDRQYSYVNMHMEAYSLILDVYIYLFALNHSKPENGLQAADCLVIAIFDSKVLRECCLEFNLQYWTVVQGVITQ